MKLNYNEPTINLLEKIITLISININTEEQLYNYLVKNHKYVSKKVVKKSILFLLKYKIINRKICKLGLNF